MPEIELVLLAFRCVALLWRLREHYSGRVRFSKKSIQSIDFLHKFAQLLIWCPYMENLVDIKDFARYIGLSMISKGISVSPLKLQKILYYEQAWHMVFFGRENQLFAEAPQAWVNGPVYPEIYREYKSSVPGMCDLMKEVHFGINDRKDLLPTIESLSSTMNLSEERIGLIDSVIMLYGSKTQNQLILVTHSERPWCEAREGLLPYQASDKEISLDTMYAYYKERRERRTRKA